MEEETASQCILSLKGLVLHLEEKEKMVGELASLRGLLLSSRRYYPLFLLLPPSSSIVWRWDPKPSEFREERETKILENFIWDMELYFNVAFIPQRTVYLLVPPTSQATLSSGGGPRWPLGLAQEGKALYHGKNLKLKLRGGLCQKTQRGELETDYLS